ncbi:hypothetical protein CD170_09735 [Staphylococcus aureus]|nr:hypothetical protein CD170_09735 [Staphylococcus aureus]
MGKKWKSLLQAQFHSVNYCQYNISEPRILIYYRTTTIRYFELKFILLFCHFYVLSHYTKTNK